MLLTSVVKTRRVSSQRPWSCRASVILLIASSMAVAIAKKKQNIAGRSFQKSPLFELLDNHQEEDSEHLKTQCRAYVHMQLTSAVNFIDQHVHWLDTYIYLFFFLYAVIAFVHEYHSRILTRKCAPPAVLDVFVHVQKSLRSLEKKRKGGHCRQHSLLLQLVCCSKSKTLLKISFVLPWPKKIGTAMRQLAQVRDLSSMHAPVVWRACLSQFFGQGSRCVCRSRHWQEQVNRLSLSRE